MNGGSGRIVKTHSYFLEEHARMQKDMNTLKASISPIAAQVLVLNDKMNLKVTLTTWRGRSWCCMTS